MFTWLIWTVLLLASEAGSVSVAYVPPSISPPPPLPPNDPSGIFEKYLSTDIPPANGFDFPVGDLDGQGSYTDLATGQTHHGWYMSTRFAQWYSYGIHPGEDWNGVGGANTDLGQPVHAVGVGKVIFAGNLGKSQRGVVVIQHVYYENHLKHRVRSVYIHLEDIRVSAGETAKRRQVLGNIGKNPSGKLLAHLHFELRWDESLKPTYWPSAHRKSKAWVLERYADPSAFIRSHRNLLVPHDEDTLVLVDPGTGRMRKYRQGRLVGAHPIGLKASLPEGMYFAVKQQASEDQLWLNFPNKFDAARARERGQIPSHLESEIAQAWQARKLPPENARLKRSIIIRSSQPANLQIPAGSMVVILANN
jgi:murein DD-endopeptidase MepM/ murein hydrolase activator NlpD